ncbi:hypothetical protein RBH26_01455 [Natronolimnohabitans sp. A-GB9]|uniref:hypothetical protein n=1 Tax=Natronolimnohabitans sp. A-GB9 TaxID=3069757 RepID=UPI0027B8604D|nr:hypothetical protein [Natronolimnohabitans sp. A-GB9]MDQ2049141.1 hypothetical protein [Natronolimnohabitans sp. A-GB9]
MTDWTLRDTIGVLVVLGVTVSAAGALEGIAQALVVLVGVVVALLWIGKFVLEGYNDAVGSTSLDR